MTESVVEQKLGWKQLNEWLWETQVTVENKIDVLQQVMLIYSNTPNPENNIFPAMCIFVRPIQNTIPIPPGIYSPHLTWGETLKNKEDALWIQHLKIAERFTMATQQLPPLQVAGDVRIQNQIGPNPHKWDKTGLVIKVKQFKQYLIRVDRSVRVTLRNLKFLRKFSCVRRQIILMGLSKNSFADVIFFGCQYQLQIKYIQSLTNGRKIKLKGI